MLEYRCPKCGLTFVTFKILCHHAESCHSIGYLLREDFASRFDRNIVVAKDNVFVTPASPARSHLLPNAPSIISDIRNSFNRIRHLRNQISITPPSITLNDASLVSFEDFSKDSLPYASPAPTISADYNLSSKALQQTTRPFKRDLQISSRDAKIVHNYGEVFKLVFHYVEDSSNLWRCRSVCKRWKEILEVSSYWDKLNLSNCLIVPQFLEKIAKWCQDLTSITLEDVELRRPQKQKGGLEESLEAVLRSSQRKIVSFSVINCGAHLTERTLWLASCHCPYLEEFAFVSANFPATAEAIWSLGAGCRRIRTLIIPPVYPNKHPDRFSDRCLSTVGKCWPELTILCIGGTSVTLKGLFSVARKCQNLEVLEFDHCGELEESAVHALCEVGLWNLRAAYFTHTPISPRAILQLKNFCKHLKKIKVIVNAEDYFAEPDFPENQVEFQRKITSLQNLSHYHGMEDILTVRNIS